QISFEWKSLLKRASRFAAVAIVEAGSMREQLCQSDWLAFVGGYGEVEVAVHIRGWVELALIDQLRDHCRRDHFRDGRRAERGLRLSRGTGLDVGQAVSR